MTIALASLLPEVRDEYLRDATRETDRWLSRRVTTVERSKTALNRAGVPHYEWFAIAYISRVNIEDGLLREKVVENTDAMMSAFRKWVAIILGDRQDALLIERVALESDAQVDFSLDCLVMKSYFRGGFLSTDGEPILVEVPPLVLRSDARFASARDVYASAVIGSPLAAEATLYVDEGAVPSSDRRFVGRV